MTGKLIIVHRKDYEIEGDNGRKYKVKGDIFIGTIKPSSKSEYFKWQLKE